MMFCVMAVSMSSGEAFAQSKKADKKAAAAASAPAATPAAATPDASKAESKEKVDINSATKEELKKIPGIGDRYSDEIIKGRPYATKRQLLTKKVIPDAVYNSVSDKIIAKRAK
jgi:DNA uptake protein ComE-like DNA-binding protein